MMEVPHELAREASQRTAAGEDVEDVIAYLRANV